MTTTNWGRRPAVRKAAQASLAVMETMTFNMAHHDNIGAIQEGYSQDVLTRDDLLRVNKIREQLIELAAGLPNTTDALIVRLKQGGHL
jgi:hypothetical protein